MKLKCLLQKIDFVPMVKTPFFWISEESLSYGSVLDIKESIGHQLLATYPGAFEVLTYSDAEPKKRTKQISSQELTEI